jgi:hypothetical protein
MEREVRLEDDDGQPQPQTEALDKEKGVRRANSEDNPKVCMLWGVCVKT